MAELPFHLKTLEPLPGALDILRYFAAIDSPSIELDQVMPVLNLSDRAAHKAIRRLVTKQYVQMESEMTYRLTDRGQVAVRELTEYDKQTGGGLKIPAQLAKPQTPKPAAPPAKPAATQKPATTTPKPTASSAKPAAKPATTPKPAAPPPSPKAATPASLSRRMTLVMPQTLVANQPANVMIGFHEAKAGAELSGAAQLVVRLSVVNGQPATPEDTLVLLPNDRAQETILITPGAYQQVRIKVQVLQMEKTGGMQSVGGMYVDVPVTIGKSSDQLVAFGADVRINR